MTRHDRSKREEAIRLASLGHGRRSLVGYLDEPRQIAENGSRPLKTFVVSLLLHSEVPEGCEAVCVFFEVDESYIMRGEVVSAAQAARELGVSAGHVSHMLAAGGSTAIAGAAARM